MPLRRDDLNYRNRPVASKSLSCQITADTTPPSFAPAAPIHSSPRAIDKPRSHDWKPQLEVSLLGLTKSLRAFDSCVLVPYGSRIKTGRGHPPGLTSDRQVKILSACVCGPEVWTIDEGDKKICI